MARVLFIHPSKWGRGITPIWAASHSSVLKNKDHQVELFDCTFYPEWTENENVLNTQNMQYRPTDYERMIEWKTSGLIEDLQLRIDEFNPDIIFWSAFSSHIHGEGEYVSIQYGYEIIEKVNSSALLIAGGLQATADPELTYKNFPELDCLIRGESELVLVQIAGEIDKNSLDYSEINGIAYKNSGNEVVVNRPQEIIGNLDLLTPYDYSLFDDQTLLRPYNGKVVRAVDYELSRGCVFSCRYCVETVIQEYYGFCETVQGGVIKNARRYLRHKSAEMIFSELEYLVEERGVQLLRCQDTNFLTIHHPTLLKLAELIENSQINIQLYIETRPEGINSESVKLLKRLKVDGIGMGIELAAQDFRESELNRFSDQEKIVKAFELLRENKIKRTAYNVIGFPQQDEESIKNTIEFNKILDPDNITVAFFTPYLGTEQQKKGVEKNYFVENEFDLDAQLRSVTKHSVLNKDLLKFYKANFVKLCRESIADNNKKKVSD